MSSEGVLELNQRRAAALAALVEGLPKLRGVERRIFAVDVAAHAVGRFEDEAKVAQLEQALRLLREITEGREDVEPAIAAEALARAIERDAWEYESYADEGELGAQAFAWAARAVVEAAALEAGAVRERDFWGAAPGDDEEEEEEVIVDGVVRTSNAAAKAAYYLEQYGVVAASGFSIPYFDALSAGDVTEMEWQVALLERLLTPRAVTREFEAVGEAKRR